MSPLFFEIQVRKLILLFGLYSKDVHETFEKLILEEY